MISPLVLAAQTEADADKGSESDAVATIQFDKDIDGLLIVRDGSGKKITELNKSYGKVMEVSFEAGIYRLVLLSEGEKYVIKKLALEKDSVVNLKLKDFHRRKNFGRKMKHFFRERAIKRESLLRGNNKVNFFIESSVKSFRVNDEGQHLVGGNIGIIVGEKLIVGFGGYGNVTLGTRHRDFFEQDVLVGYGGLMIGYNFNPRKLVNFRLSALLGAGAESKVGDDNNDYHHDDWCDHWGWDWDWDFLDCHLYDSHVFYIFEPQLDVFINLSRHFKLGLNFSYRFIDSDRNDLDGFSFGCGLQFNI